ncbi:MAG: hypothetical protein HQ518_28590 [Rhodopirellula sp.]|nr:hypothetical protein [Rhodopirellula sp.]
MTTQTVNVICIKWGSGYTHVDVNRLFKAIKANTSSKYSLNFICFTENSAELLPGITAKPLPKMNLPQDKPCRYAYQKEAGLCEDNLGDLHGERVLFFDLDTLIVGSMDGFFELPKENEFWIIKDWDHGERVGGAAVYSWVVGTLGYVKDYFEKHSEEVYRKYHTASQEYLSDKVVEKHGKMHFWPASWCVSFKRHCVPKWYLRRFVTPCIPSNEAKTIIFHGCPKLQDAIDGVWDSQRGVPLLKRIYKTVLPSPWIEKYWNL